MKKENKEVLRDDPHLKYAVEGTTALITLNRPEVKNAFSLEMLTLWRQALEEARDNDRVRAVILTGKGDAFCAGGDLQEMDRGRLLGWDMKRFLWETVYPVAFIMESLDKPVIAAVNGAA
ncbi:MAG: enoyl-CoA hydratase/isomerase family protein, partial [Desulfobacteraceae bacterium]